MPENFSRNSVNQIRERFLKDPEPLENFYKDKRFTEPVYEIKNHCKSKSTKNKILVISMGGTFYMEVGPSGSLSPSKKPLGDLLNVKFNNLERLTSLDYIELFNLDSSDIEHFHRAILSKVISKHIADYDGVVVLHGTDTMAYTASALSYMLIGIEKDVILTGAQKPGYGSSDFDRNFIKSIKSIITRVSNKNLKISPGIKIAFGDKLMIGSTVIKEDEHGINAFAPMEKHQLAGRLSIIIDLYDINKNIKRRNSTLFTDFNQKIAYFECISAINIKQFENIIENPNVDGVLIGGYDGGNMPLEYKYYISTAVNAYNKPIAFISHTDNGFADITNKGRIGEFIKSGAVALGDMIKESAYQKLCFALGLANKNKIEGKDKLEFVRKVMHTNFTGEISDVFSTKADLLYSGMYSQNIYKDEDIDKILENSKSQVKNDNKEVSSISKNIKIKK